MYSPASFPVALILTILSAICWGSWPNSYKGAREYAFPLFYWDYILSALGCALLIALTFGSHGTTGESFLSNLATADTSAILLALLAGVIWNVANFLLLAGMELTGFAVAFPVTVGIAMVEGTALSYAVQPKGNGWYLSIGLALAVAAITFDGLAYGKRGQSGPTVSRSRPTVWKKGLALNVVAGLIMGAYSPFSTRALTVGHALTPYAITVLFAAGAFSCCFLTNTWFMRHPLTGNPVSFDSFWKAGGRNHLWGFTGGLAWALGTTSNFVAASLVGVPISFSIGQSAPMISALWGIFVWKEFEDAPAASQRYLALMFAFYVGAISVIALANETAPPAPQATSPVVIDPVVIDQVVIDQDTAGPGGTDMTSVQLLLQSTQVKVLGITVVQGDGWRDEEVAHALRMLEMIGRTDIPVAAGAAAPLARTQRETVEWEKKFGVVPWKGAWTTDPGRKPGEFPPLREGEPRTKAVAEDAAHFLTRVIRAHPHEVAVVALGPMTNLALALRLDPQFAALSKGLVFMGGIVNPVTKDPEFTGHPHREFNLWFDPEAAHEVLRAAWPSIVCTTVDVSLKTRMTADILARVRKGRTRVSHYVSQFTKAGDDYLWDELAAAAYIEPSLITAERRLFMDVNLDHGATWGETITWPEDAKPAAGTPLVRAQMDVDMPRFADFLVRLLTTSSF
jgi:inosine-uridine nucleoside N-ribohydrolase/glucose uptake protein GlcU